MLMMTTLRNTQIYIHQGTAQTPRFPVSPLMPASKTSTLALLTVGVAACLCYLNSLDGENQLPTSTLPRTTSSTFDDLTASPRARALSLGRYPRSLHPLGPIAIADRRTVFRRRGWLQLLAFLSRPSRALSAHPSPF